MGTLVVYHDLSGGYRWRLRSATGETVTISESRHTDRWTLEQELERLRLEYPDTSVLDLTVPRIDGK
jgi:hypothetical protein